MEIKELTGSVFDVMETEEYKKGNVYLLQSISADFNMNQGVTIKFNEMFKIKKALKENIGEYNLKIPDCILVDNIFNLITKKFYYNKSSYESIAGAFEEMKKICLDEGVKTVALPMICCGTDKLQWKHVEKKLKKVFKNTEITFLVYKELD